MPDLLTVPITQLRLSRFNARRQRPESHVTRLAARMQRNGFEVSRALWAYQVNGHYEVFAGGTRLAAAMAAALEEVPILLYPADDPGRISRLADEDNENDEYHVPVPLPDIWAEYHRLSEEEGWTQESIAKAKMVGQASVSRRLKYAAFPQALQDAFIQHSFLTELHAEELTKLSKLDMSPWLTRDQALAEIIDTVLVKHRGSSADKAPTAGVFKKQVDTYNAMITEAQAAMKQFPEPFDDMHDTRYDPGDAFLELLARHKVRAAKDVQQRGMQILDLCRAMQAELRTRHETQARALADAEARMQAELARQARRTALLKTLQHGDCRELLVGCPFPIHLLLTDPPYGIGFQSHRRVTSAQKARIHSDTPETALTLVREMLARLQPKLAPDAHLMLFTHQDTYCVFRQVLADAGFTLRRTMTWDKATHGLGDTTRGEVLTQTEWILHAVQGNPKFEDDIERPEILSFPVTQDTELPTEKPLPLLRHLIQLASPPGGIVVDPFAGSGHTLLAALAEGRQGWACEVDAETYAVAAQRLYAYVEESLHGFI